MSAIKKPVNLACRLCAKPFGKEVIYSNGRLFHIKCAICFNCKKPFTDRKFHLKGCAMFCSKCYRYMYLPRCSGCMRPIKEMNKCIKAMEVKWHQKCFRCCICRDILNKVKMFHRNLTNKLCYCAVLRLRCVALCYRIVLCFLKSCCPVASFSIALLLLCCVVLRCVCCYFSCVVFYFVLYCALSFIYHIVFCYFSIQSLIAILFVSIATLATPILLTEIFTCRKMTEMLL